MCEILKLFARDEYQDAPEAAGNLSHMHIMICTAEKPWDKEQKKKLENIIRGFSHDILRDCEIEDYVNAGFFQRKRMLGR